MRTDLCSGDQGAEQSTNHEKNPGIRIYVAGIIRFPFTVANTAITQREGTVVPILPRDPLNPEGSKTLLLFQVNLRRLRHVEQC